jgi:hypothetical protein
MDIFSTNYAVNINPFHRSTAYIQETLIIFLSTIRNQNTQHISLIQYKRRVVDSITLEKDRSPNKMPIYNDFPHSLRLQKSKLNLTKNVIHMVVLSAFQLTLVYIMVVCAASVEPIHIANKGSMPSEFRRLYAFGICLLFSQQDFVGSFVAKFDGE